MKFKLFINENKKEFSWISERKLDINNRIVYGQRLDPKYPFNFMKLKWIYKPEKSGTRLTWIQEFEPSSTLDLKDQQRLIKHMQNTDKTMGKFMGRVNEFIKERK